MSVSLAVTKRTKAAENNIPAVVYGPKQESISLSVDRNAFTKLFKEVGESTIISLEGLESPIEVLVHELTFHPVKNEITHVDFYAIERGKEITVDVPLEFVGEAPAEKLGNMVSQILYEVEVTCRPSKLPSEIVVDLSVLVEPGQRITVADLKAMEGVTIETAAEEVIAIVSEAREEEPEEEVNTEVDMSAIEVEAKGKAEEAS